MWTSTSSPGDGTPSGNPRTGIKPWMRPPTSMNTSLPRTLTTLPRLPPCGPLGGWRSSRLAVEFLHLVIRHRTQRFLDMAIQSAFHVRVEGVHLATEGVTQVLLVQVLHFASGLLGANRSTPRFGRSSLAGSAGCSVGFSLIVSSPVPLPDLAHADVAKIDTRAVIMQTEVALQGLVLDLVDGRLIDIDDQFAVQLDFDSRADALDLQDVPERRPP